jgi:hypothetical protein
MKNNQAQSPVLNPPTSSRIHPQAHWDSSVEPALLVHYDAVLSSSPSQDTNCTTAVSSTGMLSLPQYGPILPQRSNGNGKNKKRKKQSKFVVPTSVSLGDEDFWDDSDLTMAWDAANEEYEVGHLWLVSFI